MCLRKRRYRRRHDAVQVARKAQARFGRMHAYRCPYCGHYHVGHPPRATLEERRASPPFPEGPA